jgi:hypothetical protein
MNQYHQLEIQRQPSIIKFKGDETNANFKQF